MRKLAQRHPLTLFFVLAAAFSWWPWPFYAAGLSSVPIAGFGPFLAAATVLGLTRGREGIGSLLRSMARWRVPLRAYLLALGTPLLLSGTAVALNLWLGAARPSAVLLSAWVEIPVTMMLILLVPGLGGAWEEPGFRGFALGRLERRWGKISAPLVLGVLWVIWHLPLFLAGQILATDVLTVIAASIVIAAVFHVGGESVLIAMLLHATNNAVGGNFASQLFAGDDLSRLGWLTAAAWWAAAGVVLALQSRSASRRRRALEAQDVELVKSTDRRDHSIVG
ncbi:MAG: type II CAAX endopeptidase family protein [Pseudolysinimonas sp.]